jgi:hypothetical protein
MAFTVARPLPGAAASGGYWPRPGPNAIRSGLSTFRYLLDPDQPVGVRQRLAHKVGVLPWLTALLCGTAGLGPQWPAPQR